MVKSIRWRIAVSYVLLILLMMSILGILLANTVRQIHLQLLTNSLSRQAQILADRLGENPNNFALPEDIDHIAKQWGDNYNLRVTIIDSAGRVIGESQSDYSQMDNHLNRPEIQQARLETAGSAIRYSDTIGHEMLYSAVEIKDETGVAGFLRLALPLSQIQEDIILLTRTIIYITIGASFLAIIVAIIVANQTTKPIRELADTATEIAAGNIDQRFIPTTDDEVGQLAKDIDHMALQLRSRISALQAEQQKLEVILSELRDGVIITDQSGTIVLINPSAEQLFIGKAGKSNSMHLTRILRHHQLIELWRLTQDTKQDHRQVIEIPQDKLFLQASTRTIQFGDHDYILMLFQDLTEIRRFETVRRDFISNISHELRTPLASLKALTETLQDGAFQDSRVADRFLNRIAVEVDSITHMVSELLELSRIESGRVKLHFEVIDPQDLLDQAYQRMLTQANRAGLMLEINPDSGIPDISADPARLLQVLINLIHNAVKFTPEGGRVELGLHQDNNLVTFSIADSGVGIPMDEQERIFERFYKTDRSRSGGGTGLGLSISKHIVEAHNGRIWVESQEAVGSTFYFQIPIAN